MFPKPEIRNQDNTTSLDQPELMISQVFELDDMFDFCQVHTDFDKSTFYGIVSIYL